MSDEEKIALIKKYGDVEPTDGDLFAFCRTSYYTDCKNRYVGTTIGLCYLLESWMEDAVKKIENG